MVSELKATLNPDGPSPINGVGTEELGNALKKMLENTDLTPEQIEKVVSDVSRNYGKSGDNSDAPGRITMNKAVPSLALFLMASLQIFI